MQSCNVHSYLDKTCKDTRTRRFTNRVPIKISKRVKAVRNIIVCYDSLNSVLPNSCKSITWSIIKVSNTQRKIEKLHQHYYDLNRTHLGSQWTILKSKVTLVTNISHSSRISCTEGGGSAMASATIPKSGGGDFLECEKEYCGRNLLRTNTTWNSIKNSGPN